MAEGIHPGQHLSDPQGRVPRAFARGEWKVFFDQVEDIPRAIDYVEKDPEKEGKPRQTWSFVTPFDAQSLGLGIV